MTSEALKNQKITPRRHRTANLGRLLKAAEDFRQSLELLEEGDPVLLARVLLDNMPGATVIQASQLSAAAHDLRARALCAAVDAAAELVAEVTDGERPGPESWVNARRILTLKGWPQLAVDMTIECAQDMVRDGNYDELFKADQPEKEITITAEEPIFETKGNA